MITEPNETILKTEPGCSDCDLLESPVFYCRSRSGDLMGLNRALSLADKPLLHLLQTAAPSSESAGSADFQNRAERYLGSKDITQRLGEIYYYQSFLHDAHGEDVVRRKAKLIKNLARDLRNYIVLACYGESRHLFHSHVIENVKKDKFDSFSAITHALLASLIYPQPRHRHYIYGYRETVYSIGLSLLGAYEHGDLDLVPIMESFRVLFSLSQWRSDSAYGGKRWANIATETLPYLRGEMTDMIFIDHIADIVHNGGWAFGKYYSEHHSCRNHETPCVTLLDHKREAKSPEDFLNWICIPGHIPQANRQWQLARRINRLDIERKSDVSASKQS